MGWETQLAAETTCWGGSPACTGTLLAPPARCRQPPALWPQSLSVTGCNQQLPEKTTNDCTKLSQIPKAVNTQTSQGRGAPSGRSRLSAVPSGPPGWAAATAPPKASSGLAPLLPPPHFGASGIPGSPAGSRAVPADGQGFLRKLFGWSLRLARQGE